MHTHKVTDNAKQALLKSDQFLEILSFSYTHYSLVLFFKWNYERIFLSICCSNYVLTLSLYRSDNSSDNQKPLDHCESIHSNNNNKFIVYWLTVSNNCFLIANCIKVNREKHFPPQLYSWLLCLDIFHPHRLQHFSLSFPYS